MDFNSTTQANFPLKKKKPEEDDKADSPSLTFFTPPSKKEGGGGEVIEAEIVRDQFKFKNEAATALLQTNDKDFKLLE